MAPVCSDRSIWPDWCATRSPNRPSSIGGTRRTCAGGRARDGQCHRRFRFPAGGAAEAIAKRRIGLGITGLADALILVRQRYGSEEAVRLTETWLGAVSRAAYLASVELAKEKGPFPLFDAKKYLAGETVSALDPDVRVTGKNPWASLSYGD